MSSSSLPLAVPVALASSADSSSFSPENTGPQICSQGEFFLFIFCSLLLTFCSQVAHRKVAHVSKIEQVNNFAHSDHFCSQEVAHSEQLVSKM
jgi:hypothetical protein